MLKVYGLFSKKTMTIFHGWLGPPGYITLFFWYTHTIYAIASQYGIFTYTYLHENHKNQQNPWIGKYTIHSSHGNPSWDILGHQRRTGPWILWRKTSPFLRSGWTLATQITWIHADGLDGESLHFSAGTSSHRRCFFLGGVGKDTQMLNVWYIFTYMYHKFRSNVGK